MMYVPTASWRSPEISDMAQPKSQGLKPGEGMV